MENTDQSKTFVADPSPVASYFEIVNPDEKQAAKVKDITEYLRNGRKEYDQIDNIRDLKDLLHKIGTPPLGETIFDMAWQYAKINSQIRGLEAERARLEQ